MASPSPEPARKKRRATVSRWAYWIHGVAGLKLGLVLAFVIGIDLLEFATAL